MCEFRLSLRDKNNPGAFRRRPGRAKFALLLWQRHGKGPVEPACTAKTMTSEWNQLAKQNPQPPQPEQPKPQPPQPEIPPSGPQEPQFPSPDPEPLPTPVPGPTDPGLPQPISYRLCSSGRPTICVGRPEAFRCIAQGAAPARKRKPKQKSAGPGPFPRILPLSCAAQWHSHSWLCAVCSPGAIVHR